LISSQTESRPCCDGLEYDVVAVTVGFLDGLGFRVTEGIFLGLFELKVFISVVVGVLEVVRVVVVRVIMGIIVGPLVAPVVVVVVVVAVVVVVVVVGMSLSDTNSKSIFGVFKSTKSTISGNDSLKVVVVAFSSSSSKPILGAFKSTISTISGDDSLDALDKLEKRNIEENTSFILLLSVSVD